MDLCAYICIILRGYCVARCFGGSVDGGVYWKSRNACNIEFREGQLVSMIYTCIKECREKPSLLHKNNWGRIGGI